MDQGFYRDVPPATDQPGGVLSPYAGRPEPEKPESESPPAAVTPADDGPDPAWRGGFTPFSVGDPGRAATVPAYPDPANWERHDTVVDGVVLRCADRRPPMILRAASTRGRSHRFMAKVRQDAYAFRCDGRYVVAAVADGVSSGPLSHVAADVVSRDGCYMIARQLQTTRPEHLDWDRLLEVLRTKVINEGRRQLRAGRPDAVELDDGAVGRQLATTALFAVVDMWAVEGAHPAHVFALGDTSAWVLRSGTRWEPQFPVKNDGAELASATTGALPFLPRHLPLPVRTWVGADDALLLISDGIGDPLRHGDGSVGAFLAEQWRRPPEPLAFAAHVDFARRSHDDDRTALGIWPGS